MFNPIDVQKPTDKLNPLKPTDLVEKAKTKAKVERLTRQLKQKGVDEPHASAIAAKISELATGPISNDSWDQMDAAKFKPSTSIDLAGKGLTPDKVLPDDKLGEAYVGRVFDLEGIPNGNGGVDKVRGVVSGHYDEANHGIDLVAADAQGNPIPIDVKDYQKPSGAALSDVHTKELEPEVAQWRQQREARVHALKTHELTKLRPDAEEKWKPEVKSWRATIYADKTRIRKGRTGELPVQQMDELWTQDRWLKLIKSPEGRARLQQAGVDSKYLDYEKLRASPDLPEWQAILSRRTTVILSGNEGDTGRHLFAQCLREKRSKSVLKIKV